MLDAREKFEQFVTKKGLRQSEPRLQVVEVFLHTERHVSVEELFTLVRKKHKHIGYATVSRTLKLLVEAEICGEVDFGDGIQRYEHKYGHEHHDHLICLRCGRFEEIYSEDLEKLQNKVVKQNGYFPISHKLNIWGICPKCQKKETKGGIMV